MASREDMNRFNSSVRDADTAGAALAGTASGPRWHLQALVHHSASSHLSPEAGQGLQCPPPPPCPSWGEEVLQFQHNAAPSLCPAAALEKLLAFQAFLLRSESCTWG